MGHLEKMGQGFLPGWAQVGGRLLQMKQDHVETELSLSYGEVLFLIEDLGQLVDPPIDTGQGFPIRLGRLKSLLQQSL